jgi:hypothetical protein
MPALFTASSQGFFKESSSGSHPSSLARQEVYASIPTARRRPSCSIHLTQASHHFIFVDIRQPSCPDMRITCRYLIQPFRYRGRRKGLHMLLITSDMHLTDHTVSPPLARKALERFQEIVAAAANKGAVEVIFLGDTFDLLRSKWWILAQPWTPEIKFLKTEVRPWSAKDQKPMDNVLERILLDIKNHYGWFFKALKKAGDVTLTWVVGNHVIEGSSLLLAHVYSSWASHRNSR